MVNAFDEHVKVTYSEHSEHGLNILGVWSFMCGFGFQDYTASNVDGFLAFRQTLQLLSSGLLRVSAG
jgi:hypothetical protein